MFSGIILDSGSVQVPCCVETATGTVNSTIQLFKIDSDIQDRDLSSKLNAWLLDFVVHNPMLVKTDKIYRIADNKFDYQIQLMVSPDPVAVANDLHKFVRRFTEYLNTKDEPIWINPDQQPMINIPYRNGRLFEACLSHDRDVYLRVVMARRAGM